MRDLVSLWKSELQASASLTRPNWELLAQGHLWAEGKDMKPLMDSVWSAFNNDNETCVLAAGARAMEAAALVEPVRRG